MQTSIETSTMNIYFSQNRSDKSLYIDKNEKGMHRYVIFSTDDYQLLVNEVNIAHKISKIPYSSNYFSLLEDYELLNVSKLKHMEINMETGIEDFIENFIESVDENINDNKLYLFKYNDKNAIDFIDHIYSINSVKNLIFTVINTFRHILISLNILNNNGVCFFNVSPNNIIFLDNYRVKPVLRNFSLGLRLNKLDNQYFSHIINKLEDFTYQPLEIHILFHMINDDVVSLSDSFIEEFCDNFIEKLDVLTLFSKNYRDSFKNKCIELMQKYSNLSKEDIIDDILERNNKWDVYGISTLYIKLFGSISRVFSLKGSFISRITLELSRNIHPDSDKRMTLEETLEVFDKLLDEQTDWNFINKLDNNKLAQLFDEFSK